MNRSTGPTLPTLQEIMLLILSTQPIKTEHVSIHPSLRQAPSLALAMNKSWSLLSGALGGVGEMGRGKKMVRSPREKSKGIGGKDFSLKLSTENCLLTSL